MNPVRTVQQVNIEKEKFYIFPDSACAVHSFSNESISLLLVEQWRPLHGIYTLELPGGKIEPTETPEKAALRELSEEAKINAEAVGEIIKLDMDFSISQHCTYLVHTRSPRPKNLAPGVLIFNIQDAWHACTLGKISHAPTVAAILFLMTVEAKNAGTT